MIIQDNDFLLSDAEFFELGQQIQAERSRLALLPGDSEAASSGVLQDYQQMPAEKRRNLDAIVGGLAYPVRFMRLHYSIADESISRQLIVWPRSGKEVVTLARNGSVWRASLNTDFGVRTLIKEVLGAGSSLRRDPFCLAVSSTAALVLLGILEQMHFARLYATLMNQAPDETFKAEDVLERMRQSTKEDFRWPLAMFEKVLPVRPFENLQLEEVNEGLGELGQRGLVEAIDEKGLVFELTAEGSLVADGVVHEVSKAALCVTQCRPDGVIGHDAALLVRSSFYLFLFELAGEAGVLATLTEDGADGFLARTMEAPDAEVVAAAARPPELAEAGEPSKKATQPVKELAEQATMLKERQWILSIESGPLKGRRFPLSECLKIGRAEDNDVALADTQVSRRHAIIQKTDAGYQVTDLRSGNGTLVNEVLITQPTELKPGDVVQIGTTRITVLGAAGTAPLAMEEPTQVKAAGAPKQPPAPTEITPLPVPVKPAAEPARVAPLQPAIRRCPHCGAALKPAARFCGSCGKPVAAEEDKPPAAPPAAVTPAVPARVCPKCGAPAREGVNFCKKCGTKL
jgi:pSer/pThr/pTyr-binding forkhead associated (FHA) protein